jgi:hypothetical protein
MDLRLILAAGAAFVLVVSTTQDSDFEGERTSADDEAFNSV